MSMRTLIALAAMLLAACSDDATTNPEGGPALGYWEESGSGWHCGGAPACPPPPPFSGMPRPIQIRVIDSGTLSWAGGPRHEGSVTDGGRCITVPAAQEAGHARMEYYFCLESDNDGVVTDPNSASVIIGWDPDSASSCVCASDLSYLGPE